MSVKRRKIRRGAFIHEAVSVKVDGKDAAESVNATKDMLFAASPQGRLKKWKTHAERLGVGLEDIQKAEYLIDGKGHVAKMDRFDLYMSRAIHAIDLAQMEEKIVPMAFGYSDRQSKSASKSRTTRGMTPEERAERNRRIRESYARTDLTLNSFAINEARKQKLSPSTIKKIIKSHVDT